MDTNNTQVDESNVVVDDDDDQEQSHGKNKAQSVNIFQGGQATAIKVSDVCRALSVRDFLTFLDQLLDRETLRKHRFLSEFWLNFGFVLDCNQTRFFVFALDESGKTISFFPFQKRWMNQQTISFQSEKERVEGRDGDERLRENHSKNLVLARCNTREGEDARRRDETIRRSS